MTPPSPSEIQSFYQAATTGLAALEARGLGTRRFDPDADDRWQAFKGEMDERDRLDLALRDAAARHPMAFAPRAVLALPGVAPDEPFGPDWPGLEPKLAIDLLRQVRQPPEQDPKTILESAAKPWSLQLQATNLPPITPATRLVAAGAGAIATLAAHFAAHDELDLTDQVVLVTEHPGERQLFGIAAALLDCREPARTLPIDAPPEGLKRLDAVVASPDASAEARATTGRLLASLSA